MTELVHIPFRDGEVLAVDPDRLGHLRRYFRPQMEGYVYVIEFSSGTVKVGKTRDAIKRIGNHAKEARNHGLVISRSWTSAAHTEWAGNERELISFCLKRFGAALSGEEYFTGADFGSVVEFAKTLTYTGLAPEEIDARALECIALEEARQLPEKQRLNRIKIGLPGDPVRAQRAYDEIAEMGAVEESMIRLRMIRQDWLDRGELRESTQQLQESYGMQLRLSLDGEAQTELSPT